MIQISGPTQGPGSQQETGNRQESINVESFSGESSIFKGAQKKNKLGAFAKLLQGLSVKLTKGQAAEDSSEAEELSQDSLGKTGKKSTGSKVTAFSKNAKNSPFGMEISDGENLDIGFFDISVRETGLESVESRLGNLRFNELPQKNNNLTIQNALLSVEAESEESKLALETLENAVSQGGREQSGNKTKNGRTAGFLNASFRETEAGSSNDQKFNQALSGKSGANFGFQGAENAASQETRGRRGKDRLNIEVRDLRTGEGQRGASVSTENSVSLKEAIESNFRPLARTEIEIPVELDLHKGSVDGKAGDSSIGAGRTFEDALAAELRGDLSSDIVRDAAVIIRNGGEGTIRLSLRPASLGDVKIRLEMTENKITGHIILKSSEALRAFERELPVLEKAFKDSGFSETNLEMSLASDDSANGGAFGGQEERQERDFLIRSLAVSSYEAESEQSAISRVDAPVHGEMLFTSPGRIPVNLFV